MGDDARVSGTDGFVGELSGAGVVIALDRLVTKGQLDRIRYAFPSTINRIRPTNSPVRLVAWVLDVPAQRIWDAAEKDELARLAEDVEQWAVDVATVVDDVAQSSTLAHEHGEWDAALRRVRRALRTDGGKKNGYLYRLAAHCSFSIGDWPSALRFAQEGVKISRDELGSGFVRSMCQEADAVGMSTVPEATVARALGLRVLAFSMISNRAARRGGKGLSHVEVLETGRKAGVALEALIRGVLERMEP